MSDDLRWRTVDVLAGEDYRVFRTERRVAAHPHTGEKREFVILDGPDWVNVIALTDADEVVLVRQYRHGLGDVTLEIPGGAVDPGEDHRRAAARELEEETGYTAERWERLGVVHPNPALQTNTCSTWLALDAARTAEPTPDPGEVIAVETMPLANVDACLRDGRITHALVVAAFQHLTRHAGGLRRPEGPR